MPKQDVSPETTSAMSVRPVGLSFSSLFYAAAGAYYLLFPLLTDPTVIPAYVLGAVSLLGGFGVFRMTRWGLWLGLLLFPLQIAGDAAVLLTVFQYPGVFQSALALAFVASLIILMFFASLAFLLVLDKRRTFK